MKVLAFNCSPKMERSTTSLLLTPFLDGMEEQGAEVELFYTKTLKIKPCRGRFHCWIKTPGVCFYKDDMQMLLPRLAEAAVQVFATPVYADAMSGPMKNLMDRTTPLQEPFLEIREGHCRHPMRSGVKVGGKLVLISNCGFWEMDNFNPLLAHMQAAGKNVNMEFAGALLRPHGPALKPMLEAGSPVNDVLDAAREAGRQLVRDGKMSVETLKIVGRELMSRDTYVQQGNRLYQQALDALEQNNTAPDSAL